MEENENPNGTQEVSSQSAAKLKELLFEEEEIIGGKKEEILKILSEIAQEYMKNPGYVKASPEAYLVKKWPDLFLDHSDAMQELAYNHSWLLPFRFILESDYVMDDNDLLKLLNLHKHLKELCPSKKIIEKLINDQEIRGLLVKRREESLSRHLLDFCRTYPSLDSLLSLSGCDLNEKIKSTWARLEHEEKHLIKELWCCNPIRKKILELSLPLHLADDLEKNNITDLKQLSYSKILDLCRYLIPLDRDTLKKWYHKSFANTEKRLAEEHHRRVEMQSKIQRIKTLIEQYHQTSEDPVGGTEELKQQLKTLLFGCWKEGQKELHQQIINMDKTLKEMEETLSETAYTTDEDLIANASGGLALHGLLFGITSDSLCIPAQHPLLKSPDICVIKEPSISSTTRRFFFQNQIEAIKLKRAVLATGFSFNFPADIDYTDEIHSGLMTVLEFNIYPMASYSIEQSQMKILPSVIRSLQDVNDMVSAEEFLMKYGSHVSLGVNHLGGVLCSSIQVSSSQQLTRNSLETIAKEKMKASYSGVSNVGESSVDFHIRGPNIPVPKLFDDLLKANSRSWHIIDRGEIPAALLPIWTLIEEKHNNLKDQADLLRSVWLRKAAKLELFHVVVSNVFKEEWMKVDTSLVAEVIDDKIRRDPGIRPVPVASVDNLVDILLEEMRHFDNGFSQSQTFDERMEQQQLQTRFEIILHELLRCIEYSFLDLRNEIEDLLLTSDYDWKKGAFGFPVSIDGFRKLIEEIRQKSMKKQTNQVKTVDKNKQETITNDVMQNVEQQHCHSASQPIMSDACNEVVHSNQRHEITSKSENHNSISEQPIVADVSNNAVPSDQSHVKANEMLKQLNKQQHTKDPNIVSISVTSNHEEEKLLDYNRASNKLVTSERKPYAAFLIDRPFSANNPSSEKKDRDQDPIDHLVNCLRYRLLLSPRKTAAAHATSTEATYAAQLQQDSKIPSWKANLLQSSKAVQESTVLADQKGRTKSLYDTLLQLIDEYDAAGAAEIFRLLLERRSAIPLFIPESKKHHLLLLKHITLSGGIRLGDDTSLTRVALVSCRKRKESQTCDILKRIFHIDSVHRHDYQNNCITSESFLAEIGCGCVLMEDKSVERVLVTHVIGDFRPLWPLLHAFADYLLIEDATSDEESVGHLLLNKENNQILQDVNTSDSNLGELPYVCVWKPSFGDTRSEIKEVDKCGFRHFNIRGQLGERTFHILRSIVEGMVQENVGHSPPSKRLCLHKMSLLKEANYTALEFSASVDKILSIFVGIPNLGLVKKNEFLLQKNFREQATHEEAKWEHRLDEEKVRQEDAKIARCCEKRRQQAPEIQNHPLLKLLLDFLVHDKSCSRVLSIRLLEKQLAERSGRELEPELIEIRRLYSSFVDQSAEARKGDAREKEKMEVARKKLNDARTDFNAKVLSIEHLWRELSHLYTTLVPEKRTAVISKVPRLAAQHLLDGFCIEILDGDSNLLHLDWVKEVLHQLGQLIGKENRERIFVLSVMGVQSSGKSTLLNTMFGIQMRTSVGQCTRGVNMQLLQVQGRPEYDYILLLDTEGTRSPEYHGLPGSEKRDNQMATLSILLADATIIVIPGENDAAIKEILPIVLMAYQGSKLAEENGGRRSSMLFFVYNRIDTTQKEKLGAIVQTLGTSLNEAFNQVQNLTGKFNQQLTSESLFKSFKLGAANSSDSDVCILGNVKKEFEPPGDVPNAAYGEALVDFREHIHRRVTSTTDGITWKDRSMIEFSKYMEDVWKCICSANFAFNFASVVERMTFDSLDFEYKKIEQELAGAYRICFKSLSTEMVKEKGEAINSSSGQKDVTDEERLLRFESKLRDEISPVELELDVNLEEIINAKSREKWSLQFQEQWRACKKEQERNWNFLLKTSFVTLFKYDNDVENYKKQLRSEINEEFKKKTNEKLQDSEKENLFNYIYNPILDKAMRDYPSKNVPKEIAKVYQKSYIILSRNINMNNKKDYDFCEDYIHELKSAVKNGETQIVPSSFETRPSFISKVLNWFSKDSGKNKRPSQNVWNCFMDVYKIVNNIVIGKLCYDDSIVSNVIKDTNDNIIFNKVKDYSEVKIVHTFGRSLITKLLEEIQWEWEANNSVCAKLEQDKNALYQYFLMVSDGFEKTQLFAGHMANVLKSTMAEAFEKDMLQLTSNGIGNKRWLHDARFIHKHIDLYLIDLLENNKIDEVLEHLRKPKGLYETVLQCLIARNTPDVTKLWPRFIEELKKAIQKAVNATVPKGRAQKFVSDLRDEILKNDGLHSQFLAKAFLIDCSGEYEDCDNEGEKQFQDACSTELFKVLDNHKSPEGQQEFAKKLSPKVVEYMITLNDSAALPRCDACCPFCKSLCIETVNHETTNKPHDTIHQPGGVIGQYYLKIETLVATTCSQFLRK